MKTIKTITAGLAVAAFATGTASADPFQSVDIALNASVPLSCALGVAGASSTVPVSFTALADTAPSASVQARVDFDYACNDPDGATMTYTSQNGGVLLRSGGTSGNSQDEISYRANSNVFDSTGGRPKLNLPPIANLTTFSKTESDGGRLLAGGTGNLRINVAGVDGGTTPNGVAMTTVFAGTYTDTLTMSISAN